MNRTSNFLNIVIKLLILVAIIGTGIVIYSTCSGSPLVRTIDKTAPDSGIVYEVPTVTRTYLAEKATSNDDGTVTMTHWYARESGKWVEYSGTITLPSVVRPRIQKRMLTK